MAATTGTFSASRRSRTPAPARESVSPSSELRMVVKSLMSAPAMKLSALRAAQHDRAHVGARLDLAEQASQLAASWPCPAC